MKVWKCAKLDIMARLPERAFVKGTKQEEWLSMMGSVGFDVFAFGDYVISPGETQIIPLGFSAELDPGYAALVWDRGSMGTRGIHTFHELEVIPFAGVIDNDYRGQYGVVLHNTSKKSFNIKHGDKIAQILIMKCELPEVKEVKLEELSTTDRGGKALGSTDKGTTEGAAQSAIAGKVINTSLDLKGKAEVTNK